MTPLVLKNLDLYLQCIIKVIIFSFLEADILMILYDVSASTEDNDLQFWTEEAEQYC